MILTLFFILIHKQITVYKLSLIEIISNKDNNHKILSVFGFRMLYGIFDFYF